MLGPKLWPVTMISGMKRASVVSLRVAATNAMPSITGIS